MVDSDLRFRVTGDAGGATSAFRRMVSPLQQVKKAATETKTALAGIKSSKASVSMDTRAVTRARAEIARLRDEIAKKLEADVTADTSQAQKRIRQLESSIRTLSKSKISPNVDSSKLARLKGGLSSVASGLTSVVSGIGSMGAGLGRIVGNVGVPVLGALGGAAVAAATGVTLLGAKTLQLADNLEQSKISFTQFLGSADRADKFLQGLRGFAAKTPFEFPELVDASKRLLAFNVAGRQVVPIMRTFGNVAALTGTNVNDLVTIYGQMFAKGKVANEELLQFTERGVPAYQILADRMGLSVGKIQKLASEGKLGASALKQLQIGLDEKFGGGMAKQAQTLSGLISTLKDTMTGTLTDIGDAILPLAKAVFPAIQKGAEGLGSRMKSLMPGIVDSIAGGMQGLLRLPGTLLRGLGTVTLGISGMVSGIQRSVSSLVDGIATALAGVPGISETDVSGLRKAADDLNAAASSTDALGKQGFDRLTTAAGQADAKLSPLAKSIEAARKAAQGQMKLDVQTQAFDTKISAADAKIKRLKELKANAKLDADKRYFDEKIKQVEAEKKKLEQGRSTIKLDAKIDSLREKVVKSKALLENLKKQKPTPEVRAKITELEKKVRDGTAKLAALGKKRPTPRADLNKSALDAAASSAAAKLASLDKKHARPTVSLSWTGKGPGAIQADINSIRGRTIYVAVKRRAAGGGDLSNSGPGDGIRGLRAAAIDPTGFAGMASAFASAMPRAGRMARRTAGINTATGDSAGLFGSDALISLDAAAPTVQIIVRDRKLADFVDVRVDGKAMQAAKVVERKEVLQL